MATSLEEHILDTLRVGAPLSGVEEMSVYRRMLEVQRDKFRRQVRYRSAARPQQPPPADSDDSVRQAVKHVVLGSFKGCFVAKLDELVSMTTVRAFKHTSEIPRLRDGSVDAVKTARVVTLGGEGPDGRVCRIAPPSKRSRSVVDLSDAKAASSLLAADFLKLRLSSGAEVVIENTPHTEEEAVVWSRYMSLPDLTDMVATLSAAVDDLWLGIAGARVGGLQQYLRLLRESSVVDVVTGVVRSSMGGAVSLLCGAYDHFLKSPLSVEYLAGARRGLLHHCDAIAELIAAALQPAFSSGSEALAGLTKKVGEPLKLSVDAAWRVTVYVIRACLEEATNAALLLVVRASNRVGSHRRPLRSAPKAPRSSPRDELTALAGSLRV